MVTVVFAATGSVVTAKVAVVAFALIVTLAGTAAVAGLVLDRLTTAPPAGAGPLSVNVPVEDVPPFTETGFRATAFKLAAVTVSAALWVVPL